MIILTQATEDDAPLQPPAEDTAAAGAAGVDPRARRAQRQAARAARQRPSELEDIATVRRLAEEDNGEPQASPSAIAPGAAPDADRQQVQRQVPRGARLAARRARRGGRALRRVPAALVPEDAGADDDEEQEGEEDVEDSELSSWAERGAMGSAEENVDADEQNSTKGVGTQLSAAIMQRARGRSASAAQQQQGQQQGAQDKEAPAPREAVELPEVSPMYLPVLTDEDLAADPPGHVSGYVAVIGRPNAGKSTLINSIVGQKLSIVTYKPQTTRHRVVGISSGVEHQMILFDTPGIMQEQRSKLDERMMAAVVSSIKAAEVIIAVVDAGDEPQEALGMFQPGPDWNGPAMAVLLNKADLVSADELTALESWYKQHCRAEQVFIGSALGSGNAGVEAIKAWAISKLPEGPTLYPKSMVSEQPERFFVSEIIREQIFLQYEQEIPYSCQVQITEFTERRRAKDFIRATILVERESQAPIVLGSGGRAVKALGQAARSAIEEFLGRPVYLELSVQVAPAWRQQAEKLKDFGFYDPLYIT